MAGEDKKKNAKEKAKSENVCPVGRRAKGLREKYRVSGSREFSEAELLEILIGYCRQSGAKELSLSLIEYFVSLRAVLESEVSQLLEVEGMDEETALFVHLVGKVNREAASRASFKRANFNDKKDAQRFLCEYFEVQQTEILAALFLDNCGQPIVMERISEGNSFVSEASIGAISRKAIKVGAASVIVGHNHPGGEGVSEEDYALTCRLRDILASLGIVLIEHYVISGGKAIGILENSAHYSFGRFAAFSPFSRPEDYGDDENDVTGWVVR